MTNRTFTALLGWARQLRGVSPLAAVATRGEALVLRYRDGWSVTITLSDGEVSG